MCYRYRASFFLWISFSFSFVLWGLPSEANQRFEAIKQEFETYFQRYNSLKGVQGYLSDHERVQKQFLAEKSELDRISLRLDQKRAELDQMQGQLAVYDRSMNRYRDNIARYNALLRKRNKYAAKVQNEIHRYNEALKLYKAQLKDYNNRINRANYLFSSNLKTIQASDERFWRWFRSGRAIKLWHDLDHLEADLIRDLRRFGETNPSRNMLRKLRSIRSQMQEWSETIENYSDKDTFHVKVSLNDQVEGSFVFDTGASYLTISESIAEELELYVPKGSGKSVFLTIADGSSVEGRLITIPKVKALGQYAYEVEAVILPGPSLGVDGLLGQSFLKQFISMVDHEKDPPVTLIPRKK